MKWCTTERALFIFFSAKCPDRSNEVIEKEAWWVISERIVHLLVHANLKKDRNDIRWLHRNGINPSKQQANPCRYYVHAQDSLPFLTTKSMQQPIYLYWRLQKCEITEIVKRTNAADILWLSSPHVIKHACLAEGQQNVTTSWFYWLHKEKWDV